MDEQIRESVALFRYGLIAPLLNGHVDREEYLARVSSEKHQVPHYGEKYYTAKTITSWLALYRKQGLEALKPRHRSDRGTSRTLSEELQDYLLNLRKNEATVPVTVFYDQLIKDGDILPRSVSYTTVYRLFKKHGLLGKETEKAPHRKRFAYDTVNTLWQGDLSEGPMIPVNGKMKRTYLIAFIDDCSRLVPFSQFFVSEKFDGLRTVLKEALIRRGIPKIIFCDNGKIYRSNTLQFACASLGIVLTHAQPYDAAAKGKIERLFGTIKTRFVTRLKRHPVKSLEELNKRYGTWLEEDYHRQPHASLNGQTPLEVFMSQIDRVKMVDDPTSLNPIFLKREYRKVKHDGTFSLHNRMYEVPQRFIGERIELRYDENGIHLYEEGRPVAKAELVKFADNAHVKRDRPKLSYPQEGGRVDV